MLNIHELESKWLNYKIKSYIPHAVIIISILIIFIIVLTILEYSSYRDNNNQVPEQEKTSVIVLEKKVEPTTKELNTTQDKNLSLATISLEDIDKVIEQMYLKQEHLAQSNKLKEKKIVLSPSLEFMNSMHDNALPYYEEDKKAQVKTQKSTNTDQANKQATSKNEAPEKTKIKETVQVDSIEIKRQNTREDIQSVIKRFKKSNNPILSLFVAKKYYEIGEYNMSYNYSLITNELNNNIEASWIIFTKSLVKLNKKEMAVKTLQQYVEHSQSNQAKLLLDEITSGKFK